MKKTIVLPGSLVGHAYTAFINLLKNETGNQYILFKHLKEQASVAGVSDNYNKVLKTLQDRRLNYTFVEEDGLDEYLHAHKNEDELYMTPTDSVSQVISSAALMEFAGKLYIYGTNASEPPIQNLQPHIRAFSIKKSIGTKGLNTNKASYSHVVGKSCHFKIDGKTYTETIRGRQNSGHQGVEGYTQICESNPAYRIKIWDSPKKQFEIDKVQQMINYPLKNDDIALPLQFVYNDHNNPIGFVMRNFSGESFNIEELKDLPDAKIYVTQILEQLIWLETHGFLHRDVNHNIIINKKSKKIHIIDTDSIQFKQLPACASSADPQNALPEKYETKSAFYNTIDISYTGLSLLAASLIDVRDLFGVWNNSGFCPLDDEAFSLLKRKNPAIASLIKRAHTSGTPVSLVRQLITLRDTVNNNSTRVSEFTNSHHCGTFYGADHGDWSYSDDNYGDTPIIESHCNDDDIDESNNEFEYYRSIRQENSINIQHTTSESSFLKRWCKWLKKLILSVFMTGTVADGVSDDEIWKTFIRTGLWKKPLLASTTAITAIIVLLFAIVQL